MKALEEQLSESHKLNERLLAQDCNSMLSEEGGHTSVLAAREQELELLLKQVQAEVEALGVSDNVVDTPWRRDHYALVVCLTRNVLYGWHPTISGWVQAMEVDGLTASRECRSSAHLLTDWTPVPDEPLPRKPSCYFRRG